MNRNGTESGRILWRIGLGALALACALPLAAHAQQTVYWRSETGSGLWWNGTSPKPWWYGSWGNEQERPDLTWRTANDLIFDNNNQTTHDVNGNDWYYVRTLTLASGASSARTFNRTGSAGIDMRGAGTLKIENNSTGAHVFNVPVSLVDASTEFNPVNGNLTFNTDVYLANNWINVYGSNQKYLYLNGVVNANGGSGGLAVKQDSIAVLTNNNTFTGGLWVEKGTVQLNTHSNALGINAVLNVGTNATLDISFAGTMWPNAINLYGTGTNAAMGALRKATSGALTLRRAAVTLGADSKIAVTGGGLTLYSNVVAGANTLYVSNTVNVTMSGGEMTGTKTTGDGALRKSGSADFEIRPGSGLTGSIFLDQGAIRQATGNSSVMPSGGILVLSNSTTYRSDGTTARANAKATRIDGNVTLGYSGGGRLTFSGNVDLNAGMRTLTAANNVTISGAITNGGLAKAGTGSMILLGANTYALGTLVSAGVLQVGSNGTAGSISGNVTNNAALAFYRTDSHTYAGAISGTGALTNLAGTLTLSGASTYSGATTVGGGTLLVSGSIGSSAVTVGSGATLAGAGTVGSIAGMSGGTVSPGNTAGVAGTLTVGGAAALGGGTYTCDITGTGGTDCDKIEASGAVAAASALTINLSASAPGGFSECTSYSWTIMSGSSASAANMSIGTKWASSGTFGVSASGNTIVVTHTPGAPGQPTLAASDGTSTAHAALSWDDVSCETGYVIRRNTVDTYATATALYTNGAGVVTYNDASADPGQLYYYWVTATNAGGSTASDSNSGYRRLTAPGSVAATDGSSTANVTVTWDAATGASTYHVWRDTDSNPAGATALGPQTSGYADTPTPGQLYYYWVVASNSTSSSTGDLSTADSGYRKLATVADVAATEDLSDKITVTWTDITGETGYNVWRNTVDASGSAVIIDTVAADAVSYDDTSADPDQDYYYWVRGTNSTSASMGDFSASDYGYRILGEPSTAASAIVFSSLALDSYTVGWTRGNGASVLVVAKQGSAPTDPSDSTVYAASAAFGSGDTTAAGSYVVYKGTGTSVPVTGLSAGTEYYFAVYEFNGTDTPNYRTSDEPVASRFTLVAEPTTQASSITVTGINEVTLTGIDWTDGNGASRLVVVKAAGAVDSFPVDGTTYTANAAFGSGSEIGAGNFVVHAGSGPLATLSGLTRDVVYHIRVFEFNGSGTAENYLTSTASGNPISQTTMAEGPDSNPTDLVLSSIGTTGFTVSWTKGTQGTNTLIVIRAGGNPADPSDLATYTASATFGAGTDLGSGSYAVYTNTGTSVAVAGLEPGTAYTVEATSFNGAPGAENYRSTPTSTSGSTLMAEPTQATGLSFGTLADTSYAVSYTAGNGLSRLVVAKAGGAVDWFPADGTAYTGENNDIGSAQEYGTGNFLVHRGTSPFTLSGLATETEYHVRIFEYQGTNATLNYNTNAASGNPSNRYTLSTEPTAHGTLAATAASDTEIDLDWGAATGESGFIIVRQTSDSGWTAPADGTAYSVGNSLGGGTVVYAGTTAGAGSTTDTSLSANTPYYYRIYPYAYDGTAGNATYNYYTGGTPGSDTATTGESEPASSLTLSSFVPASGSSATISWTGSGADGTIILVKAGGAVDSNPVDWNGYAADTVFGAGGTGDEIGTGNFVVYAAAGSTGLVTVTGLSAGTTYHVAVYPYNGSGTFLNYKTSSPATGSAIILSNPSAATATADGKTLIDLAWTENGYNVMIVYKSGSASTAPTQGAAYSVGSACGGGTVIFKDDGSALEHVVASGTTHHYAFYSYSGDYYSAGLTDSEATTSFASGEIVDTFSYTNGTALTGLNGETGWGGEWYGDTALFTNSADSFSTQTNYPAMSGNKLWVYPPNNESKSVHRWLGQNYTSGKLYFGYVMNFTWGGDPKWSGLAFCYSNNEEKIFFGETGAADQYLGITNAVSSYQLLAGSGNDYVIVGYYDWSAEKAYVKAYKIGTQAVPVDEPTGAWDLTNSMSAAAVGWINTIRLTAGASSGTPGNTYFDEVRIATNWAGIVQVAPSKPDGDPTNQAATADGSEMARLAWTKNGSGNDVMVVHKTSAITVDPTDGTGYSAGDAVNGGTVVYKGGATALEHVVQPGTTNFYKFYSVNAANYYSTGVVAAVTNQAYGEYEKVNPFSYTNGATLGSSQIGGQGFGANAWSVDSGTWTVATNQDPAVTDATPKFLDMDGYPAMQGNLAYCTMADNTAAKAQRSLASSITTGKFYVAFQMAYQFRGADKWAGLSLLNAGGTEKAFLGKGAGANWNTLGIGDGSTTYFSAYDLGQYYSSDTFGNTGNVYMVVGKYDFDTDVFQAKAYRILDGYTFPETEPSSWDVSQTMAGIDAIARIQLNAGATAGNPGKVFFDEIRYGTDWSHLIAVTCPTWAGSNTLNSAAWTAPASTWLGDTENFQFQSSPIGLGQSGSIEFDWAQSGAFASSYPMAWWQNANDHSYWTNQVQMTTAGVVTSRFAVAGSSCGSITTNNPALTVQNLNPPTDATATNDAVNTNSQINLEWVRGVSGVAKDTLVVRQTADSGWTAPVNGTTYNASDSLGSGTVVYRGTNTTFNDTGLAPDTTYYYRFYAENWTYYSATNDQASAATAEGTQEITIDGDPADWRGTASTVLDTSASSLQEFIWTDKLGELRVDLADHQNADLREFRVYADADWVYFLVRLTNITDTTKPFVAIGVDTRTNSASTALNWLADDSGTFIGDGYFQGGAAHFPEYQLNIHSVGGAQIEAYKHDGTFWYGPGETREVAISDANDAIEVKVARSELNLTGAKVARFTVATFLNTGVWNNDGDGTTHVADNTAAALDAMSIPPWSVADNAANLSAWLEDVSDADIDFWVDVKFAAGGVDDHAKPSTPVLVTPTNNAAVAASPNLSWQASSDSDGEVTGYLLEISTNEQFNGVTGTENGTVDLRVNLYATTTNYAFTTSASQYWWRVRARDTAGQLSAATTHSFRVVGKLDTEGPQPTLLYIGTNVAGYLAGDADITNRIAQYGPIQSVLDSELRDTNNVFGFVLRWEDSTGVYATNHMRSTDSPPTGPGSFAFNIVSDQGRVSPNWDIVEYTNGAFSREWGIDVPFYATNTLATGNSDLDMTNYVVAAFSMTNYDPAVDYYLTVSAEDAYSDGGSWWTYGSWTSFTNTSGGKYFSGWCEDGPNTARNVTTNLLIEIHVVDDDIVAPSASTNLDWKNGTEEASLVVSNDTDRLEYVDGTGQDTLYQITDGALIGEPLSFTFNAYDSYYQGAAFGATETYEDLGRTLTNSSFVAVYWQTNWANYDSTKSATADTRSADTMVTWHWPNITTQDVTLLWGPDGLSGDIGVTNLIQLDLFDVDNDRDGDQASARVNFGRVRLVDDDATNPVVAPESLSVLGTGLAREYALTNLVEWVFTGTGSERLVATNAVVPAELASSDFTNGPSGAISGTDVVTMSAGFATGATRYWLFSLASVSTDDTFKAISIGFDSKVSSLNGPDTLLLYGTMPGGSEELWASNAIDLSDPENPVGTNWNSYSASVAMPAASTGSVSFKLLAYVADTNHLTGTGTATWSVDNLIVSGYVLGEAGGTQITDQDLAYGTATFRLQASDVYSGIDGTVGAATGRAPRVDFWNESHAVVPITNAFVTNGWSAATNATLSLSNSAPAAADRKQIALGAGGASLSYYARFTATDADVDRDGDWRSVTNVTTNTVYDDDGSKPARGYLYGGPLGVYVDGTLTKAVSSGNNREYRINDEQLQTASATSIAVKVNLYDYSGWTVPTLSFSNATAGAMSTNGWLTSVHTDDVDTTNKPEAAMEWLLSQSQANTLFGSYESVTNEFRVVSAWDQDDDRLDAGDNNVDNLELTNARVGYLTFIDNDVGMSSVQSNYSATRTTWTVPKVYLGLPGDAGHSNLYFSGLPADTGESAVLSDLTNRVYDSQLAQVSAAAPLSVVLPLFDTGGGGSGRTIKGVQRGTSLTEESPNGGYDITNTSLSIGSVQTANATNYNGDLSSSLALTRIAAQFPTSVWTFASFSYADVGTWLPPAAVSSNHAMSANLYDADDNRAGDQKARTGVALGTLQVLDNDTVAPVAPTNVKVNGEAVAGGWTRDTAPWTNQPIFRVSFSNSVDGAPAGTDLEATGIGEYRTATEKSDIGPDSGSPLAVPAEGALANYGFESGSTNWTLTGAEISTEQAYEGTHSVKMLGSTAQQTVQLFNTNGYVPRITVLGAQYMGAGSVNVTVAGLDTNDAEVSSFNVGINGTAGQWTGGSLGAQSLATTVDQIQVTLTSGAGTYWDDIQVQIELLDGGTPVNEVNAVFTAAEQGLTTNYLFAVDRDNNRAGDRKASSAPADEYIPAFGTAYDVTPPTAVPDIEASTDEVGDPTTQFDIDWNPTKVNYEVGPDDPTDGNHPTGNSADRDILSPWRSYKIYYGTFDPLAVPEDDEGPGFADAYIYTNFIATGAYSNWLSVSSTNAIADPTGAGTNYLALTNLAQSKIRLFDLDFDQDYAVIVVGLDKAGNEGPASPSSWATNNTIKFAVTQGTLRIFADAPSFPAAGGTNTFTPWTAPGQKAAALYWIAAGATNAQGGYSNVTKDYDLIYRDAGSFSEIDTNVWQLSGTVHTNWFVETNSLNFIRGNVRFYRASYKDRWRDTNALGQAQRPLASEEVYALHNVVVTEGRNHVGLHGVPYTNTFAGVFGTDTNLWPSGPSAAAGATKVEFYSAGTNAPVSSVYFFGNDANWYLESPLTKVTTNLQAEGFFARAFSITLPTNLIGRGFTTNTVYDPTVPTNVAALTWHPILRVPTNGFSHTIACGSTNAPMYNVASLNLPVSVGPAQLNLPTNFTKGGTRTADNIYIVDTVTKEPRDGRIIYCNGSGSWLFTDGGTVSPTYFRPNDMIVIVSKNGGVGNTWEWTYHPTNFYDLPTRWMGE
ncbi:MAG: autotransporter-associated beta strand repeat-containing protein [Kiritimatiellia bacterium]